MGSANDGLPVEGDSSSAASAAAAMTDICLGDMPMWQLAALLLAGCHVPILALKLPRALDFTNFTRAVCAGLQQQRMAKPRTQTQGQEQGDDAPSRVMPVKKEALDAASVGSLLSRLTGKVDEHAAIARCRFYMTLQLQMGRTQVAVFMDVGGDRLRDNGVSGSVTGAASSQPQPRPMPNTSPVSPSPVRGMLQRVGEVRRLMHQYGIANNVSYRFGDLIVCA